MIPITRRYAEYAYLQIAQDGPAKAVVDELIGFRQSGGASPAGAYAVAAIPVRYALEHRDWPAAAALSEPAIGFPLERFPWAAAADLDATMDKHPATPSSVLPARELLADLLLELNQPAAALVEYRAMLSTDPNRFRSLVGEARAAKQTGDSATAHDAYGKLMALSKPVGPARPELAEAKSYLAN